MWLVCAWLPSWYMHEHSASGTQVPNQCMLECPLRSCLSTQTEGCVLCMSTQSARARMPMQFMLENPNIPWTSYSQFVHQHPDIHPKCCTGQVLVAGAAVMPLGTASCETGEKTPNAPSPTEEPSGSHLRHTQERAAAVSIWEMRRERWLRRWGWRCALGRKQSMCKECIPRDWLQDNSWVLLISLILHVFYRSVRNITSGTRNRSCLRSSEPAACDSATSPWELKPRE